MRYCVARCSWRPRRVLLRRRLWQLRLSQWPRQQLRPTPPPQFVWSQQAVLMPAWQQQQPLWQQQAAVLPGGGCGDGGCRGRCRAAADRWSGTCCGACSCGGIQFLVQSGFTDVKNVTGGIDSYSRIDPSVPTY
ncbi:hypothetical protein TSOC_013472 [Tetrabaena socialis]|uniref:Rhodanese domain-containing protein n=1 Tax=Tetrabaena socialis TaxID=47790 RepID=A0A2J7ZKA7_9CHLO|nr:hypothetical protein TSOC_013472 [Tetrabaena socialis]|eukprot:PNH00690.1 hypothetical protein TSOC_013472 [Tetrabaena socialis]